MNKTLLLGFAALMLSPAAHADWEVTAGYANFSDVYRDANLGALTIGADYNFMINDRFSIVPGIFLGTGIKDDERDLRIGATVDNQPFSYDVEATVKLSNYYGVSAQARFDLTPTVYLFATPSYSKIELKYDVDTEESEQNLPYDYSFTDDLGWHLALGLGAGFRLTDMWSLEAGYEFSEQSDYDTPDIASVKLRLSF